MNVIQFLKQVDHDIAQCSREEMDAFVHELARTLPEAKREEFLEKLKAVQGSVRKGDIISQARVQNKKQIKQETEKLQKDFQRIEDGEFAFDSSLNEEYDEWYNDDKDEFIFSDPQGIVKRLEHACELVHQCIDNEFYDEGCELFWQITGLHITIEGDYADYGCDDEPEFYEAVDVIGLDLDVDRLILDGLYAAYQSVPMKKRPQALYDIIDESGSSITLEALMQAGEKDLPEWEEFLNAWVSFLGKIQGKNADRLLKEALNLQNGHEPLLAAARTFVDVHPELYMQYLARGLEDGPQKEDGSHPGDGPGDEEMLAVGQEALRAICPKYLVRSRTALLTAVYALRLKQQETAERCWLEAFRSDTREVNYLRLCTESTDFSIYRREAAQIIREGQKTIKEQNRYFTESIPENRMHPTTYFALTFFQGDFQQVIEKGMNTKEALGWSSTFMKYGIELFLLYLYRGNELSSGCRCMCMWAAQNSSFHKDEYAQGLLCPSDSEAAILFWQCFCKWKASVSIPEEQEEAIIKRLEKWIALRVEGIMEKNHRNYYGECAAFIAALGEVKESRGESGQKARLMESYKTAYPRRRSFHAELRRFGMKK